MGTKSLREILSDYLKGTSFVEINNTITIQGAWEKTVGKPINKNTEVKSFKNGTIIIKASNPIWRNELSFQKQALLEKLQKKEPKLNIKEIILK